MLRRVKMAYLFVHFKEKRTPNGEQVYFGISQDGFHWEQVNEGKPVLWSYVGEKGVRDMTIVKTKEDKYVILATDLSLAYGMPYEYQQSWQKIKENGSSYLVKWESEDLINWTRSELVEVGNPELGCCWAPDIIYDRKKEDYIVHWSSPKKEDNYQQMAIYYTRTKDFKTFTKAKVLYQKEDGSVIDSAIYEENGWYYLFVKSDYNPSTILLLKSKNIIGPYERVELFDEKMQGIEQGLYEAATAVQLPDNKWYLFLDYYGAKSADGHGYVPFVSDTLASGDFERCELDFSFPYGFKHGTIIKITDDEMLKLKQLKKSADQF